MMARACSAAVSGAESVAEWRAGARGSCDFGMMCPIEKKRPRAVALRVKGRPRPDAPRASIDCNATHQTASVWDQAEASMERRSGKTALQAGDQQVEAVVKAAVWIGLAR